MSEATSISTPTQTAPNAAPAFEGFPYLVTRIVASLHHILLLPRNWDIEHLIGFAQNQVQANRLPTCLVLAGDLCVYFNEDGSGQKSGEIPRGTKIESEKLQPSEPVPDSTELSIRRMKLILFEEAQNHGQGATIIMGGPCGCLTPTWMFTFWRFSESWVSPANQPSTGAGGNSQTESLFRKP